MTDTRAATLADVPGLVAMGAEFLRTTGYATLIAPTVERLHALAAQLVQGPDATMIVVERDGVLIGMIGLVLTTHHLSGERMAGEVVWWVDPAHRGHGRGLLRAAETWALAQGACAIHMTAPNEEVAAIYTALDYHAIETTFEKRFMPCSTS